ncbi:MAG TPA: citrate/2-methylcitrate synthase [Ktedonobacteraceae bacterium]|nr:citrate/2-methylcitrate synthase [Ktedonobacteraceae bacterium]
MTSINDSSVDAPHWFSALTRTGPNHIFLRGYEITELMGQISFGSVLYLLWTGQPAPRAWAPVLDALLVAAVDHGAGSPSALTVRTVISGGGAINAAAAAGLLTMGEFHGAAVSDAMTLLYEAHRQTQLSNVLDGTDTALQAWRAHHRRIPGLGHRLHTKDPRVERLRALAQAAGLPDVYFHLEEVLAERASQLVGKPLPINIDGGMASALCAMQFPAALGNAFFYVARLGGLLAHAYEEQQRMPPMRRIHPTDFSYDGPASAGETTLA